MYIALYHVTREQGNLVALRLWAEEGVGRAKLTTTKKRQSCASDSGVLPEPWPGTEQGVRQDDFLFERIAPKPNQDSEHHRQPKDKESNLITQTKM